VCSSLSLFGRRGGCECGGIFFSEERKASRIESSSLPRWWWCVPSVGNAAARSPLCVAIGILSFSRRLRCCCCVGVCVAGWLVGGSLHLIFHLYRTHPARPHAGVPGCALEWWLGREARLLFCSRCAPGA
jgi:hypothetical protein